MKSSIQLCSIDYKAGKVWTEYHLCSCLLICGPEGNFEYSKRPFAFNIFFTVHSRAMDKIYIVNLSCSLSRELTLLTGKSLRIFVFFELYCD